MITCVIIDDEELARKLIETYVDRIPYMESLASFENPLDGMNFIKTNTVDLVFLDIQMPQLKGTEFAELLAKKSTQVIFTTAYSEYAIKGFELNVLDYLLKPITFKRFLIAVERLSIEEEHRSPIGEFLKVKSGYEMLRLSVTDITYIQSDSEYVHYYLNDGKKVTSNQSLTKLIPLLPEYFIRIHRSYIVNGSKVKGLKGRELRLHNDQLLPVSLSYYDKIKSLLF